MTYLDWLGVGLGVALPMLCALLYPTWTWMMEPDWVERTRLLGFPFVLAEIAVIMLARRAGFDPREFWRNLPLDLKIGVVVLIVAMFVSSLSAKFPQDAVLQSIIQVIHLYFAVAVWDLARRHGTSGLQRFWLWLTIGLVVMLVWSLGRLAIAPAAVKQGLDHLSLIYVLPGYINGRYLGTWAAAIAAGALVCLLYEEPNRRTRTSTAVFLCAFTIAIWTGTRAAVLGIAFTPLVFLCTLRRLPKFEAMGRVSILTGLGLTLAYLMLPDDASFYLINTGEFALDDRASSGRFSLWVATWERWLDSPLLGWGTGSTFYEVYLGWTHTQPHNAFLQFLISWGLVGAAAALWLLGRALFAAHAAAIGQQRLWPYLGLIYAYCAMSMVDGSLYYPRFITIIMVAFAVILATKEDSGQARAS